MPDSLYLIDILILLAAAMVAVPLFKYLHMGAVPGFLAGGAIVGPWGLGFISEVEEIRHLAEFGVVFLLFVIGIELKPSRLWVMRRSVFGLGMTQVLLTGLILSGLAVLFGLPNHTALVIGFSLSLSSTAFGLQILAEKGDLQSVYGRSAFSILLFQDLAVVPLIALVPLLGSTDFSLIQDVELAALETLLILIGVLLLSRFLLHPLLNIVADLRSSPEVFVATAIFIVLGAAWLTDWAGLSMGLGSFLAGMLLSDSRYRHQIMADIQPFRGILLGLFFMTVGMSIDFGLLNQQSLQVAGLVLGLLFVKATLLWTLCRATGSSQVEAMHVALLLPQGGEFAFVLFGLAYGVGVMSIQLFQLLVLVVVMSMVLTPLLFKIAPLLGRLPTNSLSEQDSVPDKIPQSHNHVIVAGFGRFGQHVVHILAKAEIPYRALDINPARVTDGRARGYSVYYGDVSRLDVLQAAGVNNATLLVFAVDKMDIITQVVATLDSTFPQLPIYARVPDARVGQKLRNMGVNQAFPEILETSLQLSREVLRVLNIEAVTAARLIDGVRRQENEKLTKIVTSAKHQRFKNILLVLSPESDASVLLGQVTSLMDDNQVLTIGEIVGSQDQRRQHLDELIAPLRKRFEVEAMVYTGTPHLEIINEVLRSEHDLVVKEVQSDVGIHDRLSSHHKTDIQLLRKCPCPVWFIRSQPLKPSSRILAAVDVDSFDSSHQHANYTLNRKVLELATSLAILKLAELDVVHVWQAYGEDVLRSGRSPFPQHDTDSYVAREHKRHEDALYEILRSSVTSDALDSIKTRVHLLHGEPFDEIIRQARSQSVDLLIIGGEAHTGIQRYLMGNIAEAIFCKLECSVLVVKSV